MNNDKYDDIIDLPHYEPRHPRMTMESRAAQFAPFAALPLVDRRKHLVGTTPPGDDSHSDSKRSVER